MDANIEALCKIMRTLWKSVTPDEACAMLLASFPADQVREARQVIEKEIGRIRVLRDPPSLVEHGLSGWYAGPMEGDRYWPAYYQMLLGRARTRQQLKPLDDASSKIVSLLEHPGVGSFDRRGLVLGYVQSGKTENFTAVIAKAADAGYRMFIVLSGLTNKLRRQTQIRLDAELRDLNREQWVSLTDADRDFGDAYATNADAFLTQYANQKTLCVVKKVKSRLERLKTWLESASSSVIASCPVLIIDDEADQASLNASADPAVRTQINALLCGILEILPRSAYVGYTATPFANMFVDPSNDLDLYPRDFIVDLPKPDTYFGAEKIFGRDRLSLDEKDEDTDGFDIVRRVPEEEVPMLRPAGLATRGSFEFSLEHARSLREALLYFWMATAARFARGQADRHSTMLIHSSPYANVHEKFRGPIERFREKVAAQLEEGDRQLLQRLWVQWETEQARVPSAELGQQYVSFEALSQYLPDVLGKTRVVVENYMAAMADRLTYGDEAGVYIVIGGSILARGLTLEGLVTSHFVRSATAYDTLLQMGRWFGYRSGYEDLPRIWMTDELRGYFYDLATVEQEVRYDIRRYEAEHLTPAQFAPRIRTHPDLMITSRLKMQHAVKCYVSYSRERVQTILFNHRNREWLAGNMAATRQLLAAAQAGGQPVEKISDSYRGIRNVPAGLILGFIRNYSFHEESWSLRPDILSSYIEKENRQSGLLQWNIVIVTQQEDALGRIDLGLPEPVNMIRRTRLRGTGPGHANIKALMSPADMVADLGIPDGQKKMLSRDDMFDARQAALPGNGLLVLYPISRNSKAADGPRKIRADLDAVADVIGVGFVFPETVRENIGDVYMTADLSNVPRDEEQLEPGEEGSPDGNHHHG